MSPVTSGTFTNRFIHGGFGYGFEFVQTGDFNNDGQRYRRSRRRFSARS